MCSVKIPSSSNFFWDESTIGPNASRIILIKITLKVLFLLKPLVATDSETVCSHRRPILRPTKAV